MRDTTRHGGRLSEAWVHKDDEGETGGADVPSCDMKTKEGRQTASV